MGGYGELFPPAEAPVRRWPSHRWAWDSSQVLLGIRTNMLAGGARIDPSRRDDYSEAEAREAFNRMVREHGWY